MVLSSIRAGGDAEVAGADGAGATGSAAGGGADATAVSGGAADATAVAEGGLAAGLEAAGAALDASGIGLGLGIALGVLGLGIGVGSGVADIVGWAKKSKDDVQGQVEQTADTMKQAAISAIPSASPSAGSFVITSMNGASLNHLPSSMSHF